MGVACTRTPRASLTSLLGAIILAASCALAALPASAQTSLPPAEKIQALIKLLDDPEIRKWVESRDKQDNATAPTATKPNYLEAWENRARTNIRRAAAGLPMVFPEYAHAWTRVAAETRTHGMPPALLILSLIVVAAATGEWALRRFAPIARGNGIVSLTMRELTAAATFAAITVALFFIADWPPMLRAVLRSYLFAAILLRFTLAQNHILVSAGSVSRAVHRKVILFFGLLFSGLATMMLTAPLEIDPSAVQGLTFCVSLAILLVAVEALWTQSASGSAVGPKAFQTISLAMLWIVWAMGFHIVCWIGLFALFLPKLFPSIEHFARAFAASLWPGESGSGVRTVLTVHGLRTLILTAAAGWMTYVWNTNPLNDTSPGSLSHMIVLGLIKSVVVLLVADFSWRVCKALIDRKLASVNDDDPVGPEEAARRARFRTLLPVFRNALAALVLLVTILTVLAELGVEIGPLIAGAGIFGVAIGFGSQTLVKDVISGIFYLMDDAFRIGEYIQSGSYMGTVESFSLRSVRLRHHRGPVFTVPFGELGAVQNMSRDWVIDKFLLRVTFDADIAKAKKLTKAVGAALLADEDVGHLIIDTVKMKGVEQINEYGVELGFAFRAKPGNQAVIRRRAYAMIRKSFAENGISFAQPTVQVGGDDRTDAAAAALTLAEQRRQAEAAAAQKSA